MGVKFIFIMAGFEPIPEVFNSPTNGQMDWDDVMRSMIMFMGADTQGEYEVIVGTDSEAQNSTADFVSAFIVHKKGRGGVYFWCRQKIEHLHSLKQRIWKEAEISLFMAQRLVEDFGTSGMFDLNLEIHVDIGPNGKTRELISDIVGMIRANGFKVATKPSSWGASHVADRHV